MSGIERQPSSARSFPSSATIFGIDQDDGIVVDVDDGDALDPPDLRRGEPDPLRGVHRLEHVVDELAQVVGDLA